MMFDKKISESNRDLFILSLGNPYHSSKFFESAIRIPSSRHAALAFQAGTPFIAQRLENVTYSVILYPVVYFMSLSPRSEDPGTFKLRKLDRNGRLSPFYFWMYLAHAALPLDEQLENPESGLVRDGLQEVYAIFASHIKQLLIYINI